MATELTWLGHGCWLIETGEYTILLDPFLDNSPTAPLKSTDVAPTAILISHAHFDHTGEVVSIAQRTGAVVISNFEVSEWVAAQGHEKVVGMNIGGQIIQPFGTVKMTQALHSSSLPDGAYGGNPAGFIVSLDDGTIYFACDTGLFLDMQLIGTAGIDLAVLPIGDLFTMGPDDAVEATKLIMPKRVAPAHYNTFPPIEQDAEAWAKKIRKQTDAEPIVVTPGGKITL
ncbi:MAG: metal-dependent hydrolase [Planctomycetales bacterium]|nr:metal-dependent hydrolase [Planctomycetales bacterium]